MQKEPRLLVWNFTTAEKEKLDTVLREIGAPFSVSIEKTMGHLTLREIIDESTQTGEVFTSDEKAVLFYNIPQKGIFFLIDIFKNTGLPRSIYAVVTEHSINWPFNELLQHLLEEREKMER